MDRQLSATKRLQSRGAQRRSARLGLRRLLRPRSGAGGADDRELPHGSDLEAHAAMRAHAQGFGARGLQRRLAMSWSSAWKNPTPAARYPLLVVGAGPAGVAAAQE